jgi:uncharacterized protein YbdZ (MbtH family)
MDDTLDSEVSYRVVVNDEEQHSIWPDGRDLPSGWRAVGNSRSREECLEYIEKNWTDMRPRSLRERMEKRASLRQADEEIAADAEGPTLTDRLSAGDHQVDLVFRRPGGDDFEKFQESLQRGVVHVRFPETQGGTVLGLRIDQNRTVLQDASFDRREGSVHLVGEVTLDYVECQCLIDLDLQTLKGIGHLEKVDTQ